MREYGIPEWQARVALMKPDCEYHSYKGRFVAERVFRLGRRLAVQVVYNVGLEGERVVVTVMRGRSRRKEGGPRTR